MAFNKVLWIMPIAVCLLGAAEARAKLELEFLRVTSAGLPLAEAAATLENVKSFLDCARMCHPNFPSACCSYGYNQKSRRCILYTESHGDIVEVESFAYFVGCPTCPSMNNCTYYKYDDQLLLDYTLWRYPKSMGASEANCKCWCSANDQCKGFDLRSGDCFMKFLSKGDVPTSFRKSVGWGHYEKHCA